MELSGLRGLCFRSNAGNTTIRADCATRLQRMELIDPSFGSMSSISPLLRARHASEEATA